MKRPSPQRVKKLRAALPQYCVRCGSRENLTLDHKLALSLGGDNSDSNFQILCGRCNLKKSRKEHQLLEALPTGVTVTWGCRNRRRYVNGPACRQAIKDLGREHDTRALFCRQCKGHHFNR